MKTDTSTMKIKIRVSVSVLQAPRGISGSKLRGKFLLYLFKDQSCWLGSSFLFFGYVNKVSRALPLV